MTVDDKFGIGAGLVALGLAAGVILFAQLRPDVFFPSTVQELASETPAKGEAAKPAAVMESPHRGLVLPEAICDGIVCVLALPAGIYFFWLGAGGRRRAAIGVGHFLRRGHWVGRGFSALPFFLSGRHGSADCAGSDGGGSAAQRTFLPFTVTRMVAFLEVQLR